MLKISLWALLLSIMLSGCASTHYYVLSTPSLAKQTYSYHAMSIGVEKVSLPKYLFKREIAVVKSSSEVAFLSDGIWAEDLDESLTQRLIGYLQKSFNQPHVYAYPWEVESQPRKRVQVHISRFIAQEGRVYLDAAWQVEDMPTHHKKAALFSTTVEVTEDTTTGIVKAMDSAFAKLETSIAKGIRVRL